VPSRARHRLLRYLRNALAVQQSNAHACAGLCGWAATHGPRLGLALPEEFVTAWRHDDGEHEPNRRAWRMLDKALSDLPEARRSERPFAELARLLGLDPLEEAILTLAADYEALPAVENLWDRLADRIGMEVSLTLNPALFATLLDQSEQRITRRLRPDAALRSCGLLTVEDRRVMQVLPRLVRLVQEPSPPHDMQTAILGPAAPAPLHFAQYAHLGASAEHVRAMLKGAMAERAAGIHVLLYGPPGTGKTSFAAALAEELAVPLHEVGLEGPDGEEPERRHRLGELRLSLKLLAKARPAMLLMDEAEDVFDAADDDPAARHRRGSRSFVHRLLETAPVPVIWTANSLDGFSPAVLRRMSCAIELRVPGVAVREQLWREAAEEEGIHLPEAETRSLARSLPAAPALARSAMRAARLAGGEVETVRWALSGVVRAMADGRMPLPEPVDGPYRPELINADTDLAALADRLACPDSPRRVSLLLSGPPGSGKSAFARHLASRMGMPVLLRRASDLLDCFVGGTEQKIAAAFAEARDSQAFLIFDEADSLLGDRRHAHQGWEVSQVNEMLTWMEGHPLPFCCTTNLSERLDAASMRRFLFKGRFGFLTAAQLPVAWETYFEGAPPAGLAALDRLTPADFALVTRQAALHGWADPGKLLSALESEQRAKPGLRAPVGFKVG